MPQVMALRVVSLPAMTSRMKNEPNSCGRQALAVDLGVHQRGREVVAWVGQAVLAEVHGVLVQLEAVDQELVEVDAYSGSLTPRITLVQANTCCSSAGGMPIISQMTCSGRGAATASTKSHSPSG